MNPKILIVDDHQETRSLVASILRREGYVVVEAENGRLGFEAAQEEIPNLIILDVMMPEMDGFSVCRKIRGLKENPVSQVPIIMFTAKSQPDEKWEGFEAGANDYLLKPTNTDELLTRVRTILHNAAPLQEASNSSTQVINGFNPNIPPSSPPVLESGQPQENIVCVIGSRGGSGATTTAINLAYCLAAHDRTLLIDFDMAHGHVGLYLNKRTEGGLNAIAAGGFKSEGSQPVAVTEKLFLMLSQPNISGSLPVLSPDQMTQLVSTLKRSGQQVVIDAGTGIRADNRAALALANQIVICLSPERIGIAASKDLIAELTTVAPQAQIHIVLLSIGQAVQFPRKAVENFIGRPLDGIVKIDLQTFNQAVNQGKPLVMTAPKTSASITFNQLAAALQPLEPQFQR